MTYDSRTRTVKWYFSEDDLSVCLHHQRRSFAGRKIVRMVQVGWDDRTGTVRVKLTDRTERWQVRLGNSSLLFLGCLVAEHRIGYIEDLTKPGLPSPSKLRQAILVGTLRVR